MFSEDGEERLPEQISNFTMEVVRTERFADDSEAGVRRTIRLTADTGFSIATTADPEQICNKAAFKKFLLSKGNFHFWGNDSTVELLMAKIFRPDGAEVLAKQISGYEPDTGNWIFGNGAIGSDSRIYRPDSEGIIRIGERAYRMEESDLDTSVSRAPKPSFNFTGDYRALLKTTMQNTATLWGPQTELAWGWLLAVLWRTEWLHSVGNFPLLFVVGPRALGKNTFMRVAMQLFGMESNPISLNGLTDTSIYTVNNRFCNIPVWLDEYKNDIKVGVREALKGNYDGSDQVRGTPSPFVTKTRRHRTGLVTTGEARPSDSALDSRSVTPDLVQKPDHVLLERTERQARELSVVMVAPSGKCSHFGV